MERFKGVYQLLPIRPLFCRVCGWSLLLVGLNASIFQIEESTSYVVIGDGEVRFLKALSGHFIGHVDAHMQ